ncbi:MAG: hypothetical protein L0922_05800, partial [Candidatus Mariimomonas ferrooxydans]
MELYNLTISQALKAILKGEISPLELTNAIFTRIEAVEDKVRAYVTLTKDDALRKARQAQNRIKTAPASPHYLSHHSHPGPPHYLNHHSHPGPPHYLNHHSRPGPPHYLNHHSHPGPPHYLNHHS